MNTPTLHHLQDLRAALLVQEETAAHASPDATGYVDSPEDLADAIQDVDEAIADQLAARDDRELAAVRQSRAIRRSAHRRCDKANRWHAMTRGQQRRHCGAQPEVTR